MSGGWGLKETKLINHWGKGAQLTKATRKDKQIPGSLTVLCICVCVCVHACRLANMFKCNRFPHCSKYNSCVCGTQTDLQNVSTLLSI